MEKYKCKISDNHQVVEDEKGLYICVTCCNSRKDYCIGENCYKCAAYTNVREVKNG